VIEFALPWAALLLPLPLIARLWLRPAALREPALYFPRALQAAGAQPGAQPSARRRVARLLAMALAWIALVAAATGPRWVGDQVALPASGRDLMLAVDISESMLTQDLELDGEPANRLRVVKRVAGEFLRRREGDRLGLILFGSNAYLHVPLTFDHATVERLLAEARIGFAGKQTAIGDALAIAVKRLRERPEQSRVLILLTDGANTAGELPPRQAAELAARAGLRVYTVGIGAEEMELPGIFGSRFGARRVNPSADLDEDTLRFIASQTGGKYFRARDRQELESAYTEVERLEPVAQEAESLRPMVSLAHWPLALALALTLALALAQLWPWLRRRAARSDGD
jgi:Ca-activated chloride channel family protein